MNTYWNAQVICPYYLRTKGVRLSCEWKEEGEITQRFKSEREIEDYLIYYCSKQAYKKCALCVVNDRYYDEKELINIKKTMEEVKERNAEEKA